MSLALLNSRNPTLQERAVASRQLAVMIRAGVPIERALRVLGRQEGNRRLARAWRDVHLGLLQGQTLSRGMARNSDVFGFLDLGLARVGEASGAMVAVFEHLATLQEREVRLRARVRAALTYPVLVTLTCLGVAFLLVEHVLPTFLAAVLQGAPDLPWFTRALMAGTAAARNPAVVGALAGVALAGGLLVRAHLATPQGRSQFEQLQLEAPVLGPLCRKVLLARLCQTLATLLRSSMPARGALEVASSSLAHRSLTLALEGVLADLEEGFSVAEAFQLSGFFPALVHGMLAVGEEAGDLAGVLQQLADFYEQELEASLECLAAALEPLLVGAMGIFVGGILVALFIPLYQVLSTL